MHGISRRHLASVVGGALLILALLPAGVLAATPPTITSAAGTTFTVGVAGVFSVTTTGTPNPSITKFGSLPTGVTLVDNHNGTATLFGTPASGSNSSYSITILALNGVGAAAVQGFTLTVSAGTSGTLAFTSAASTTFAPSVYSTFSVTATGTPTPYIALASGSAPGVTFTPGYSTASLSGTPTTPGTYTFQFAASSTAGTVYQTFTLTVGSGSRLTPVTLTGASALGASATSGFSTPTKILAVGQSITIRVTSSPQLAGTKLGVWIAIKGSNNVWGAYKPHTSVTTDATGTAYYTYTFGSKAWLAFRLYYGGSTTYAPAWSYPSQFGRAM